MASTVRILCKHRSDHALKWANEALEWANEINKLFRHPIARIGDREVELAWDRATDIDVVPGSKLRLQVFMRAIALNWCGAEIEMEPIPDGEVHTYEYHVDFQDGWVKHGHLARTP